MNIERRHRPSTALLIIDMQKGFLDSGYWGRRNNPDLEKCMAELLSLCRQSKVTVIHVQHLSTEAASPLRPGQPGVEFMECALPIEGEWVLKKSVNSAFIGTNLEVLLTQYGIKELILAGLTSDHCVSTTARMASNLGFKVLIPHETVATFDRVGFDESIYPAELVHQVNLASLDGEFAGVLSLLGVRLHLEKPSIQALMVSDPAEN